jgi:hypothetical protein
LQLFERDPIKAGITFCRSAALMGKFTIDLVLVGEVFKIVQEDAHIAGLEATLIYRKERNKV